METKSLKKKVGCALMVAGLLAASSVRGSGGDTGMTKQTVKLDSGWKRDFSFPKDYRLVCGQFRGNNDFPGNVLAVIMVKEGSVPMGISACELARQDILDGFLIYNTVVDDMRVDVVVPDGFVPAMYPDGTTVISPGTHPLRDHSIPQIRLM
jgi:hypothetical protein